jgi:phosphopantetheinyl transferase
VPQSLNFSKSDSGKPHLALATSLQFNLSHTSSLLGEHTCVALRHVIAALPVGQPIT